MFVGLDQFIQFLPIHVCVYDNLIELPQISTLNFNIN
jgi:hypothetical protein